MVGEGPDTPLAENDLVIPLVQDVFGRQQQLGQGGAEAALEENRAAATTGTLQQGVVLHVARADLYHIAELGDDIDHLDTCRLGDERNADLLANAGQNLEPLATQSLETVGTGARLESATSQETRSSGLNGGAISSTCS